MISFRLATKRRRDVLKKDDHYKELRNLFLNLQRCMKGMVPLIDEMQALKVGVDSDVLERLQALDSLSSAIVKKIRQNFCGECGGVPAWVRETQSSGKSFFCDKCARKEPGFLIIEKYGSYFWKKLESSE